MRSHVVAPVAAPEEHQRLAFSVPHLPHAADDDSPVVLVTIDEDYIQSLQEYPIPDRHLADALDQELIGALKTLSEAERAVLLMRALGDLRYREMAEALDIPLGSVMGNLSRARRKMQDAIARGRRRSAL